MKLGPLFDEYYKFRAMKNQPVRSTLLIAVILLLLNSCQAKLTRNKAASIISTALDLPHPMTRKISHGDLTYSAFLNSPHHLIQEKSLHEAGLMKLHYLGEENRLFLRYEKYNYEITPAGQKYCLSELIEDQRRFYIVKVADIRFLEVTGIMETAKGFANVDFTWTYANPTPFGKCLSEVQRRVDQENASYRSIYDDGRIYHSGVTMALYDDGWRVTGIRDEPGFHNVPEEDKGNSTPDFSSIKEPPVSSTSSVQRQGESGNHSGSPSSSSTGSYEGAWFAVDIPKGFKVKPSLKSTTADGYDSAFFTSPDQKVEFYIFSPLRDGEPTDILFNESLETKGATETKTNNGETITWYSYAAKDGSYTRAYQETNSDYSSVRWVVGIKYQDQQAYNSYKNQYMAFKKSLVQYTDH